MLIGKTLVFTDQHFGVKGNASSRQKIGILAIKGMVDTIQRRNIKNVIFCGDYFHQRNALTVDTLNIAYRCLQALAKHCAVYMILGNHDLFNKSSTDVNSINIFRDNSNIHVIDTATEIDLNGKKTLLVPWLADLSAYYENEFDFMFGHFEISSKFLIASYVHEHSNSLKASSADMSMIDNSLGQQTSSKCPDQHLGNFIDLVKRNGTIFAGHIHQHKEIVSRGRNFIFIGSPYQQNLGDIGCQCGYYIIDENGNYEFFENNDLPKHVKFLCSDIEHVGISKYDFSPAKGNIVQKVYDIDVSMADDLKINQEIASFKPYEELLPDYQVALDFTKEETTLTQNSLVQKLKKSKLDYVENYIDQLDGKALKADGIEKKELFSIMKKYYKVVVGETNEN